MKDKGLQIVAINAFDKPETVNKYMRENRFTFPVLLGGRGKDYILGRTYGVQTYPANFLIGPDAKILWREVGFDERALRTALAAAGIR